MSDPQPTSNMIVRDGTSQSQRIQAALQPDYVSVDERSLEDLLAFAEAFSKELRYFNEQNQEDGDWSAFLDGDVQKIAAYLNDSATVAIDANQQAWLARPHRALFFTFLKLLQSAQIQLNDLTRRHLEFYYRDVLALTVRPPIPDRVHVLLELAKDQNLFKLAKGSSLSAGKDSQGVVQIYQTEQDIFVNRAMVSGLKSLFVKKQIIGLREVRINPYSQKYLPIFSSLESAPQAEKTFLCMLALALGSSIGDALPLYQDNPMDAALLGSLDKLLDFIRNGLYLPLPAFRSLMQTRQNLDVPADSRWNTINTFLQNAGKSRIVGFNWRFTPPDNFDANFLAALGLPAWGAFFDTLPEVDDIYDLYRLRERQDVKDFIVKDKKLFMSFADFVVMMEYIDIIFQDWRRVHQILRAAARKKQPGADIQSPNLRSYDPNKFNNLVSINLGAITFPSLDKLKSSSFDECYREFLNLEAYFHVSAESFLFIRQINAKTNAASWEWDQVDTLLENAHINKVLKDQHGVRDQAGFDAMLSYALGDPGANDPLPEARKFMELDSSKDATYIREKLYLETSNFQSIKDTQNKQQAAGAMSRVVDWTQAYQMLLLAQNRKRGEPRLGIEQWRNAYAAEHAPTTADATPWPTFGGNSDIPISIGFAVASPILALAEGTRTITLTLTFSANGFDEKAIHSALAAQSPFGFWLSGQKGMLALQSYANASITLPAAAGNNAVTRNLQITLTLQPQFPPVAPCPTAPNQTALPFLQIRLNNDPDKNDIIHRAFAPLLLQHVLLKVDVAGVIASALQNDDGVLNNKKPFEPFGVSPSAGCSLYFAHPELCSKKLDSLTIKIDWLGAPDNLNAYYQGYQDYASPAVSPAIPVSPISDNSAFKADLQFYDNRGLFSAGSVQLFNADNANKKKGAISTSVNILALADQKGTFFQNYPGYSSDLQRGIADSVLDWNRYWRIELAEPNFQHALYARAATAYANRKNAAGSPDPFIINPPYTPKIKQLRFDYTASLSIELSSTAATPDQLFHIEPFGYRELTLDAQKHWLPQYPNEGELFIGIQDLAPPQTLSLLFQIAEDSADPDVAKEPLRWWYLDSDCWLPLDDDKGKLLADDTDGLLHSGIVCFNLPPAAPGTLLPPDCYWIRISLAKNSRSVGNLVGVHAQAIRAVFSDQGNAADHWDRPLPANSISGLSQPLPEIKAVLQPYSSSGGKGQEQPQRFYTRVSERLRHKNRALTCWDYERLVLEAFPDIYKVKCLPVGSAEDPRSADEIQIVVIPNIRGRLPFTPFEPKASTEQLDEIKRYLGMQRLPLARYSVNNPRYLRLTVRVSVRFNDMSNPGYYQQQVNQSLLRYLAPWAYDDSAEIVFGGKINANLIINMLERLFFVDYVAGIKLFTDQQSPPIDENYVIAADTILVSAQEHYIDLISEDIYEDQFFSGINYMKIELDFAIA